MSLGKKLSRRKGGRGSREGLASRTKQLDNDLAHQGGSATMAAAVEVPAEIMKFLQSEDVHPVKHKSASASLVASPLKFGRRAGNFWKTNRLSTFELVCSLICCVAAAFPVASAMEAATLLCRNKFGLILCSPLGFQTLAIGTTCSANDPLPQLLNLQYLLRPCHIEGLLLKMLASALLFGSIRVTVLWCQRFCFALPLDWFASRSNLQPSRLLQEEPRRESGGGHTVLRMDSKVSGLGTMLLSPKGGQYYYAKGLPVQPASWFTCQVPKIKDLLRNGDVEAAAALFQKLQHEAELMVRYGVEALEALSKTCRVPHSVAEFFLYDVCPTLGQPFIDNVSVY